MRLLPDTHCSLWMIGTPERLTPSTVALLGDPGRELLVSAASAWEISIKAGIGKLTLPGDALDLVPQWMVWFGRGSSAFR